MTNIVSELADKKMKTKFSTFPHFLGNQTYSQQAKPQKK